MTENGAVRTYLWILVIGAWAGLAMVNGRAAARDKDPAQAVIEKLLAEYAARKAAQEEAKAPPTPEKPAAAQGQKAAEKAVPAKPAPPAATSVEKVLDELAAPKAPPQTDPKTPAAQRPTTTKDVIDDLIASGRKQQADNRQNASRLREQAQGLAQAGKLGEALKLARQASRLVPDDPVLLAYVLQLEQMHGAERQTASSQTRALARLAAGLNLAQRYQVAGQYRQAVDLLNGVIGAAELFQEGESGFYRELAQRELARYRAAVDAGQIPPDSMEAPEDSARLAATSAMPPVNYRRLFQAAENQVPPWYAWQKNRLAFPMTVDYRGEPAALVFEDIGRNTGLDFVIDLPVTLSRQHQNTMVDLRTAETPAETILDLACQKSGLEYLIMERAIVITTPAKAVAYLRQLPEGLRHHWAAVRVLFPELSPELLANPPARSPAGPSAVALEGVPAYLQSGRALVDEIRRLLDSDKK